MSLWSATSAPTFATDAARTVEGYKDPVTGELLVAFRGLSTLGGDADVADLDFGAASYVQGAPLSVAVRFNENVDVSAGASLVVSSTQGGGNTTLYAAAQTGVSIVTFNKKSDNTTQETVPASVAATGTLTFTGTATNTQTVTIGAKVYTFQTTLTNVDGNVLIGADQSASCDNLVAAINLGAGAGTTYAAAMTLHPTVSAARGAGNTVVLTAKTPGSAGNAIATTETLTNASFGGATLSGGVTNSGTLSVGAQTIGGTIVDSKSAVKASQVLTLSANPANTETVTLGSKVYTFQTTLTNVDGNVKIGATAADSLDNLVAAINLDAGAGTQYATAMTVHPTVVAERTGALTMKVTAKTAGTAGNSIASTETLANGSFGAATLAGGVAAVAANKAVSAPIASAAGTRVVA